MKDFFFGLVVVFVVVCKSFGCLLFVRSILLKIGCMRVRKVVDDRLKVIMVSIEIVV